MSELESTIVPSLKSAIQLFESKLNSSSFWWLSNSDNEDHFKIPLFEKINKKSVLNKYDLMNALQIVKEQMRSVEITSLRLKSMEFEKLVWNYRIMLEVITYLTGLMSAFKKAEKEARAQLEKDPEKGKKEYRKLLNDAEKFWGTLKPDSNKIRNYFTQATGLSLDSFENLLLILEN